MTKVTPTPGPASPMGGLGYGLHVLGLLRSGHLYSFFSACMGLEAVKT